jgi:protein arginine kinase
MRIEDLLGQTGEWLKGVGPESDVVISSRIRLARNLHRFPFLTVATPQSRAEIETYIRTRVEEAKFPKSIQYWPLARMSSVDRTLLVERHLISREHAQAEGDRGVALGADETISVMVNEEDHLRIQVIRSGLQFDEAYQEIDQFDSILEDRLNYAFHPRFGYLTACPTNVGTGMRLSVMMHLPASVISKQMDKVLQSLQRLNYTVRGLFGEGTQPLGDFYQISNQVSLGKSEKDIIGEMRRVIPEVLKFERSWRYKLMEDEPKKLEDKVWRAYGILKNARRVTTEEAIDYLSSLRLGSNLNLIRTVPISLINQLFITTQPSHLQKIAKKTLAAADRDVMRADLIRERLEKI